MNPITLDQAEYMAHRLSELMFTKLKFEEPIPPFSNRYPGILESCLNQPFVQFGGEDLYEGLEAKAFALFFFCIKNHPFENGNKRFAVAILLVFLAQNGKWLEIDPVTLYEIAKKLAQSKSKPEHAIDILMRQFGPRIVKF